MPAPVAWRATEFVLVHVHRGDKAHLGGFTKLDLEGVSPGVWRSVRSALYAAPPAAAAGTRPLVFCEFRHLVPLQTLNCTHTALGQDFHRTRGHGEGERKLAASRSPHRKAQCALSQEHGAKVVRALRGRCRLRQGRERFLVLDARCALLPDRRSRQRHQHTTNYII